MSRRKARETALQSLFQLDFNKSEPEAAFKAALEESLGLSPRAVEFSKSLVLGAAAHMAEIDEIISKNAKEWKVERMAGVDRNIVRMAVYELTFGTEDITPNIVINEAVELAKKFGSESSGKFVNGILGTIAGK
jgi:N utilization substance protein B